MVPVLENLAKSSSAQAHRVISKPLNVRPSAGCMPPPAVFGIRVVRLRHWALRRQPLDNAPGSLLWVSVRAPTRRFKPSALLQPTPRPLVGGLSGFFWTARLSSQHLYLAVPSGAGAGTNRTGFECQGAPRAVNAMQASDITAYARWTVSENKDQRYSWFLVAEPTKPA